MLPERMAVAGVVLAAGSSSRMGVNKLLLPLGGSTVLRRAVAAAAAADLDPVLVVLGPERERALAELGELAFAPVVNPEPGRGIAKRHRAEAIEVAWPPAALADLDVPSDLERARAALEGS